MTASWPKTFKEACCEHFKCSHEQFEQRAFRYCLPRHSLPVAMLVQWIDPEVFKEDFDLLHEIGAVTSPELFQSEIDYFHGRNVRHRGWIRGVFRIRVSGKRLLRLKRRTFGLAHHPRD